MKGLLTKDFRLLLQRKRFFMIMVLCAVCMGFSMDDTGFVVGWICMIAAIFSLSTLSYDEYDNSMPFLMSLPLSGKQYAVEKYLFGLICGMGGWLFAFLIDVVFALVKKTPFSLGEELLSSLIFIPLIMIVLSISLPAELKWGTEKGRTAMLLIAGFIFAGLVLGTKILPGKINIEEFINNVNLPLLVIGFLVLTAVITAVSMAISIRIMAKKEY